MTNNITLFRFTKADDLLTKTGFNDKVVLDVDSKKNTKNEGVYYTDWEIFDTNSLVRNQAVNMPTGMLQDLGKFEIAIKLTIVITKRRGSAGSHASVKKLKKWRDEELQPTLFKEGRFGIKFDDFIDYNETPKGTGSKQSGLLFYDLHWKSNNAASPPQAIGTLWFVKSRGDGS